MCPRAPKTIEGVGVSIYIYNELHHTLENCSNDQRKLLQAGITIKPLFMPLSKFLYRSDYFQPNQI